MVVLEVGRGGTLLLSEGADFLGGAEEVGFFCSLEGAWALPQEASPPTATNITIIQPNQRSRPLLLPVSFLIFVPRNQTFRGERVYSTFVYLWDWVDP